MSRLIILFVLYFGIVCHASLTVDSVTVDSVWNSDSTWYDDLGILQERKSRDCIVGFKPEGQGKAECSIELSIDGGGTWGPNPNPLRILDDGMALPAQCGIKKQIKLRVFGGDRPNMVFRITGRQYQPIISGDPKKVWLIDDKVPGDANDVLLQCKHDNDTLNSGFAPITEVYWDALADDILDASTSNFTWIWQTTVPMGESGQKCLVIVKALDFNGLFSEPCTLTVRFGLPPIIPIDGNGTIAAFKMDATEVTQELYMAVMGTNPSGFNSGGELPVENVTFGDAVLFCNELSKMCGRDTVYIHSAMYPPMYLDYSHIDYTQNGYRLPTKAEWVYACRAGVATDYYWGRNYPPTTYEDTLDVDSNAVFDYNSNNSTLSVAGKKPNMWGLYDMSGNVWEFVNDISGTSYVSNRRVIMGGCYNDDVSYMRSGSSTGVTWTYHDQSIGFRLVRGQ